MKSTFTSFALALPLAFALTLTISSPAFARIGETKDQCIKRYGKPASESNSGDTLVFRKADFEITCNFQSDNCWKVQYAYAAKNAAGVAPNFSDATIAAILDLNVPKAKWSADPKSDPKSKTWLSKDHTATHFRDESLKTNWVSISTNEASKQDAATREAAEAKAKPETTEPAKDK